MKKILFCTFTVLGGVIGAGFLSGRELVRFFGVQGFLPLTVLSSAAFFFFVYFFLFLGAKKDGYAGVEKSFPPLAVSLFRLFLFFSSFVSLSGMFAGLSELLPSPVWLLPVGVTAFFLCRGGVKKLGLVNAFFVPVALCYFIVCFVRNATFSYGGHAPCTRAVSALLYAGMNAFLSVPVLCDLGKEVKGKQLPSALVSALVFGTCIFFLLAAVRSVDGAENGVFPLLSVFGGGMIYRALAGFACFTTLISSFYSLYRLPKGKSANAVRILILLAGSALSFFGFYNIVEYAYPILGAVGCSLLLLAICYQFLFHRRDDRVHSRRHQAKQSDRRHHEV